MLHRRGFLTGLFSAMAAPAIVRAASLMPVKAMSALADVETELQLEMAAYNGAELAAVIRRAFLPRQFVQLYQTSPMMTELLRLQEEAVAP